MDGARLGRVAYLNCLPIFHALEIHRISVPAAIIKGFPNELNAGFLRGELEVTAVSSLAYGQFTDRAVVLPALSISSNGQVQSVALVSHKPMEALNGLPVSLTPYSATSVALLQIILKRFYGLTPEYFTRPAGSPPDWGNPEAALVIGDEALRITQTHIYPYCYDLGTEWKLHTGKQMVFALWVAKRDFACQHPEQLASIWQGLIHSKEWGKRHPGVLVAVGADSIGLSPEIIEEYFTLLNYDLEWSNLEGLFTFYRMAHAQGLLEQPVTMDIWGGSKDVGCYRLQSA